MKIVPYGLRYIAKKIYQISKERFPDSEEKEILRTVSFYVIYKFIGSAIANPDDFKIVETNDIPDNVKSTLAYVAKALQLIFRFSDADDVKLVNLNSFMKKKHDAAKSYLIKILDVPEADQYLQVNRYNKLTGTQTPSIVIELKEIVLLHSLVDEHKDKLITVNNPKQSRKEKEKDKEKEKEQDQLVQILKELGDVPTISDDDVREIQMDLINRYEVQLKDDQKEKDFKKKFWKRH